MNIEEEYPGTADVHTLLLEHLADMRIHSPPESVHALDLSALREPNITFWAVREEGLLKGCGAIKQLNVNSAEIKSMKTAAAHLRKGVAELLLRHIISIGKERNIKFLLLETGTPKAFAPARKLYEKHGFVECEPFDQYTPDPYSVFMRLELDRDN